MPEAGEEVLYMRFITPQRGAVPEVGDEVLYMPLPPVPATIVSVHSDDNQGVYYTIKLKNESDRIIQTVGSRILHITPCDKK